MSLGTDEVGIGDVEFAAFFFDVLEEAHAIGVVAGGGLEIGDEGLPVGVEARHEGFAEVFAEHGGDGDGEALGFGFFGEDEANGVVGSGEAIFAVAVDFFGDFEGPVFEHELEDPAVVFAATLAIAEDDEVFVAEGAEEMVDVSGGE